MRGTPNYSVRCLLHGCRCDAVLPTPPNTAAPSVSRQGLLLTFDGGARNKGNGIKLPDAQDRCGGAGATLWTPPQTTPGKGNA